MEQVEKGLLDGPPPYDSNGQLPTGEGPGKVNPAFRFGVNQEEKLRAAGALKRSRTNAASAIHSPLNLPTWDHFAAVVRMFEEGRAAEGLAFAKAGHGAAYRQLPDCEERKRLAAASLGDPESNKMGGFIPHTRLFGATAAALGNNAVSGVMASIAARWLGLV